ncbi:hypothetical protein SDC9_109031 [bioreactor metagenome]|uniref:Uncharacterized protein n=1 Tax=bioreactor metagenome TaxID=1076179 RepID=A0A645B9R5_9ZZZZ
MNRRNIRIPGDLLCRLFRNRVVDRRAEVIPELRIGVRHRSFGECEFDIALFDRDILRLISLCEALHRRVEDARVIVCQCVVIQRGAARAIRRRCSRLRRRRLAGGVGVPAVRCGRCHRGGLIGRALVGSLGRSRRLHTLVEGIARAGFQSAEGRAVLPGCAAARILIAVNRLQHDLGGGAAGARRRIRRITNIICLGNGSKGARHAAALNGACHLNRERIRHIRRLNGIACARSDNHRPALPGIGQRARVVGAGEVYGHCDAIPCLSAGQNGS